MSQSPQEVINALVKQSGLCHQEALFKIDEQGQWLYLNSPLPQKFSRLFSTILYCIDNEYFLITPAEKLKVEVVNVPLRIVDYICHVEDDINNLHKEKVLCAFTVITSLNTQYTVDSLSHFVCTEDAITVGLERGLIAKLNRACYYRFIDEFI